jgi:hypothetical protein
LCSQPLIKLNSKSFTISPSIGYKDIKEIFHFTVPVNLREKEKLFAYAE